MSSRGSMFRVMFCVACWVALGCAQTPPGQPSQTSPPPGGVRQVEVGTSAGVEEGGALARLVAQSARDWLEQRGRLSPDATAVARVEVDTLRLRGRLVTWLFAWAAAPDHLGARVRVERPGALPAEYRVRVESRLAGYSWRDPGERRERLARRLGLRIAEGL